MISKVQAQTFYSKLKKTMYPPDGIWTLAQFKMSPKLIAIYMGITEKETKDYCDAIVQYGLSEWEGELLVI